MLLSNWCLQIVRFEMYILVLFKQTAVTCTSLLLFTVFRSFSDKVSQSSILSQPSQPATDEPATSTRKNPSFQEFVNKQIDYMMTVESREVPAEGRRGTHVEVCIAVFPEIWLVFPCCYW